MSTITLDKNILQAVMSVAKQLNTSHSSENPSGLEDLTGLLPRVKLIAIPKQSLGISNKIGVQNE